VKPSSVDTVDTTRCEFWPSCCELIVRTHDHPPSLRTTTCGWSWYLLAAEWVACQGESHVIQWRQGMHARTWACARVRVNFCVGRVRVAFALEGPHGCEMWL
jgi:hypothetical protein